MLLAIPVAEMSKKAPFLRVFLSFFRSLRLFCILYNGLIIFRVKNALCLILYKAAFFEEAVLDLSEDAAPDHYIPLDGGIAVKV